MNKLTEHAQDRPYSEWAKNETIVKSTSRGLKNSDHALDEGQVFQNEKRQRKRFNEWDFLLDKRSKVCSIKLRIVLRV